MAEFMNPARRGRACRTTVGGVLLAGTVLAGGCAGTLEDVWPDPNPTYKSSRSAPPLEIPPDLTRTSIRDALQIPGVDATYSQYASGEASSAARGAPAVLPEIENARIERSGDQRWLVVAMKPEETWPRLRDFWTAQGLALETEEPDIGVMATEWAERHQPLSAGIIKRALLRISKAFYGVAFRDRYTTRIERGSEPDTTDIYIAHRGAEQVVVGAETMDAQREGLGTTVWQPRPNDPGLEAEMLSRLMIFLGLDEERADAIAVAGATPEPTRARLVRDDDGTAALVLDQGFSQAWRRTGLALDRAGLAVEDRDRSRGLFFVRYDVDGAGADEDRGWLARLVFWGDDDEAEQGEDGYVVNVVGDTPESARIVVLDVDGAPVESPAASRILALLHEQLQ